MLSPPTWHRPAINKLARWAAHIRCLRIINHCSPDVSMAQKFLHRADIVACIEKVRGERMESMTTGWLRNPGFSYRCFHVALDDRLIEVVSPLDSGFSVEISRGCRKNPLPGPLPIRGRILPAERVRKPVVRCRPDHRGTEPRGWPYRTQIHGRRPRASI